MARRITNLILRVGLLVSFALPGASQPASDSTRHVSFWGYRVGNGNWTHIKFESRHQTVDTISLGKFLKGRVYEYEGPARLVFFRERFDPTPDKTDHIVRLSVAQTSIPSGVSQAILIFTPAPKDSPSEFTVHFVDAGATNFPANSLRIFNATGVRLAGKVGRENQYFETGISKAFSLTPYLNEKIPITFLVETNEGPKFVFEKAIEFAAQRRVILVLEPPRRKGSYKIQATNLIETIE